MASVIYKKLEFNIAFQEFHPPLPLSFFGTSEFLKTYRRITGTDVGFIYAVKDSELTGYMEAGSTERITKSISKKLSVSWLNAELKNYEKHVRNVKKVIKKSQQVVPTRENLVTLFNTVSTEVGNIYPYSNAFYLLSPEIEKRIIQTLYNKYSESEASQILANLSTPIKSTLLSRYSENVKLLAKNVKKDHGVLTTAQLKKLYKANPKFKKQMDGLRNEYFYLTSLNAGARTVDSLLPDVAGALAKEIEHQKTPSVPKEIKENLHLLKIMIYFKDEISTHVIPFVHYNLTTQWAAAAKFLGVTVEDMSQLTMEEVMDALTKEKDVKTIIRNRKSQTLFFHAPFKETKIFQGLAAEQEMKQMKKQASGIDFTKISEITGKVGSSGNVTGPVHKILNSSGISSFKKGHVLVAIYTAPEFVPAMKKAVGIITDTGGITCHAAIVSRELGIPCVVGAKIATEALNDGDIVEVDARKGIVKIIERFAK